MEKLALKIPMLIFFLAVVYYMSVGFGAVDAVVRSFMLAFGVALIILVFTLVLMFFLTLQTNRLDDSQSTAHDSEGKKVEVRV